MAARGAQAHTNLDLLVVFDRHRARGVGGGSELAFDLCLRSACLKMGSIDERFEFVEAAQSFAELLVEFLHVAVVCRHRERSGLDLLGLAVIWQEG